MRLLTLLIVTAFLLPGAAAFGQDEAKLPVLVVLPFANSTSVSEAGIMAADVFIRELHGMGRFELVHPSKTLPLLVRDKLGSVDVDERDAGQRYGTEVGADFVLLGSVTAHETPDEPRVRKRDRPIQVDLSVRLINTHPGDSLWMCSRTVATFGGMNAQDTLRAYAREMVRLLFEEIDANLPDYEPGECVTIDLRAAATTGFQDDRAEDRQGGWTDDGDNDFRTFPTGQQTFCGVPFEIINAAQNEWRSCIALKGGDRQYFPAETEPIPVGEKLKTLYFLHTAAYCTPDGHEAVKYVVTYEDDVTAEIPALAGSTIGDWWNASSLPGARLAWKGDSVHKDPNGLLKWVGCHLLRWQNPSPEKTISTLQIVSGQNSVPLVLAITGEK